MTMLAARLLTYLCHSLSDAAQAEASGEMSVRVFLLREIRDSEVERMSLWYVMCGGRQCELVRARGGGCRRWFFALWNVPSACCLCRRANLVTSSQSSRMGCVA